ncbi:MAG: transcription/translation regulatory transformer protein RfaH [Chloroflexi bacterium]|nr:transcription/translation regulatory transformer protein RfaH [Chloroflexota bacterium]
MQRWYVARTKVRREVTTAAVLEQRGIETYLPILPAAHRSAPRVAVYEPLFPGYLFARLDATESEWLTARSAPGIAYFLGGGGDPTPVPDELVESIRTGLLRGKGETHRPPFKPGEIVVIDRGPFAGLEAVFDGWLSARGRVRVLLELVERLVPVEIHVGLLKLSTTDAEPRPVAV